MQDEAIRETDEEDYPTALSTESKAKLLLSHCFPICEVNVYALLSWVRKTSAGKHRQPK
jgi:hypothetical protein